MRIVVRFWIELMCDKARQRNHLRKCLRKCDVKRWWHATWRTQTRLLLNFRCICLVAREAHWRITHFGANKRKLRGTLEKFDGTKKRSSTDNRRCSAKRMRLSQWCVQILLDWAETKILHSKKYNWSGLIKRSGKKKMICVTFVWIWWRLLRLLAIVHPITYKCTLLAHHKVLIFKQNRISKKHNSVCFYYSMDAPCVDKKYTQTSSMSISTLPSQQHEIWRHTARFDSRTHGTNSTEQISLASAVQKVLLRNPVIRLKIPVITTQFNWQRHLFWTRIVHTTKQNTQIRMKRHWCLRRTMVTWIAFCVHQLFEDSASRNNGRSTTHAFLRNPTWNDPLNRFSFSSKRHSHTKYRGRSHRYVTGMFLFSQETAVVCFIQITCKSNTPLQLFSKTEKKKQQRGSKTCGMVNGEVTTPSIFCSTTTRPRSHWCPPCMFLSLKLP